MGKVIECVVGSAVSDKLALEWDTPQREIELQTFDLSPRITWGQWVKFLESTGYHPDSDEDYLRFLFTEGVRGLFLVEQRERTKQIMDMPVTGVSYDDAEAYSRWVRARLPTEFELEIAMGNGYPMDYLLWSCDDWDPDRLKKEDLRTEGLLGTRYKAVRGQNSLRFPFKISPQKRYFVDRNSRLERLSFCVCHTMLFQVNDWIKEGENRLFDLDA